MRVAWLLGTWPSPTETFLAREMAALERLGIEVLPYAFRPGPDGPAPGVRYRPAAGPAVPRLPRRVAGVLLRGLLHKPSLGLRWLRNLPFAVWLRDRLREERCDLLHAAWCGLPAMTAWLCRQLGGPPYTVAGHAYDVFTAPEAADEALLAAEGVTVCNRAAEQALLTRLPALAPRLAYNPHGIPLADWPRRAAEPAGDAVILGVGRLVEKKGFEQLVKVIPFLPRAGRPYVLRILGEGPERGRLAALARDKGVNLELPGHVSETEVRAALQRATVLVLPSRVDRRGDRDGVANVLLEAMAVGTPVLTTTASSAGDVVTDGETGRLVAPDFSSLGTALAALLQNGDLRRRLADAARKRVEQDYDTEVNAARLAAWLRAAAREDEDSADGR